MEQMNFRNAAEKTAPQLPVDRLQGPNGGFATGRNAIIIDITKRQRSADR
ncbi:MAG: hypothetical protein LUC30_09620 [Clostridiales bacterium]|nr:hypothetical protein [Clostridiales bacterium]